MRFVFVDEAGTSASEPVTIVVGLIVDADQQMLFAEMAIKDVLGSVPQKFQDGFWFHADDIWNCKKYRQDWAFTERLAFLKNIMALPRRLGLPISLGIQRRSSGWPGGEAVPPLTVEQYHHYVAFKHCIANLDHGNDFAAAIFGSGHDLTLEDFNGPTTGALFYI